MDDLLELMAQQAGLLNRAQALDHGLGDHDIRRLLRRREWATAHPGVYVDHTGQLSWHQRSWAAVLATAPSVLWQPSAIRAVERAADDDGRPIHVAVARKRFVVAPRGVVCHRITDLETRSSGHTSPPRQRYEDAVVGVAATAPNELDAVAVLAAAVGSRRTTAQRLANALAARRRVPRRAFLAAVLDDVAGGTCSVLEHAYLDRVERPHGLPRAARQLRETDGRTVYRDVAYEDFDLLVELDGRFVHGTAGQVDLDLERDLLAAVDGRRTVRLGWGQVLTRSCATATAVAALLRAGGWRGPLRDCGRCAGSSSPDDSDPALSA